MAVQRGFWTGGRFAVEAGDEVKLYGLLSDRDASDAGGKFVRTCGTDAGLYALGRGVALLPWAIHALRLETCPNRILVCATGQKRTNKLFLHVKVPECVGQ